MKCQPLFLMAALTALTAAPVSLGAPATVTVHPEKSGPAIPADFLGLSYEKNTLGENHFRADNAELQNLCRNLGGGVLRFGGNQVEATFWSRTGATPPANAKVPAGKKPQLIGPAALDGLYAFAKASGWRVLHGLNLGAGDPAMSADEAAYAMQVGGPLVLAFEVGNEPDFYPRHETRATNYAYADYRLEAQAAQNAIRAKAPQAPLAGPATTKFATWLPDFVRDFKGTLALATTHYYSLSAKSKDPRSANFATVENLLSPAAKKSGWPMIEAQQQAAQAAGIPLRVGECNSISSGGTVGVSDTFASALWGADFLFDVAERGVAGINFHGAFKEHAYTALAFRDGHYPVRPLYYAMLLFHQAARGRVVAVDCQTSANLTAHAVLGDDRKLRVVLINKDLAQAATVSLAAEPARTKGQLIRLTAPSVTVKEGVKLADASVQENGTWTPQPGEAVAGAKGQFEISLPPASAALLTLE